MPSTPLTCCSIGSATVSITVLALAPGYRVVTCTVGGTTSGYCAMARLNNATPPMRIIRMAMTLERTGRSMKNLEIMSQPYFVGALGEASGTGMPALEAGLDSLGLGALIFCNC